jgi:hypothetical protein
MNYLYNIYRYAILMIGLFSGALTVAQERAFPVPDGNPNQLFYLQRTPNANTVIYELNEENGSLNTRDPIRVFWIRYAEKGQKAELNPMQRDFAYGIKATKIDDDNYELHFVAYKQLLLHLRKGANKKYLVYAKINQKPAVLVRIYLHMNGGSLFSPHIEYIELKGVDPDNGTEVIEKIIFSRQ